MKPESPPFFQSAQEAMIFMSQTPTDKLRTTLERLSTHRRSNEFTRSQLEEIMMVVRAWLAALDDPHPWTHMHDYYQALDALIQEGVIVISDPAAPGSSVLTHHKAMPFIHLQPVSNAVNRIAQKLGNLFERWVKAF